MKPGLFYLLPIALVAFFAALPAARADANPDFDDDAKPILRMQPGLLQYVETRFEVKDTGTAKYPGDDDRRPGPPFIFRARPIGSHGPYNLRLLIQPGPAGHILGVVDMNKVHLSPPGNPSSGPAVANEPPPQEQPQPSAAPAPQNPAVQVPELAEPPVTQQPAPAPSQAPAPQPEQPAPQQPNEPTSDTPSGPIMDSGSSNSSGQSNLAPPPDPAPAAQ
jgi:hypothetical protein